MVNRNRRTEQKEGHPQGERAWRIEHRLLLLAAISQTGTAFTEGFMAASAEAV